MFYNAKIDEGITAFVNTLTEEKKMCEILENIDNNVLSRPKISEWKKADYFLYKTLNLDGDINDLYLSKKCRYIINSIRMSFRFAHDLIGSESKKNISNIKVVKLSEPGSYTIPSFLDSDTNKVFGFLFISGEKESVSFEYKSTAFFLQEGSLIISEPNKSYRINNTSNNDVYIAFGEFL